MAERISRRSFTAISQPATVRVPARAKLHFTCGEVSGSSPVRGGFLRALRFPPPSEKPQGLHQREGSRISTAVYPIVVKEIKIKVFNPASMSTERIAASEREKEREGCLSKLLEVHVHSGLQPLDQQHSRRTQHCTKLKRVRTYSGKFHESKDRIR